MCCAAEHSAWGDRGRPMGAYDGRFVRKIKVFFFFVSINSLEQVMRTPPRLGYSIGLRDFLNSGRAFLEISLAFCVRTMG